MRCPYCKGHNYTYVGQVDKTEYYRCSSDRCQSTFTAQDCNKLEGVVKATTKVTYDSVLTLLYDLKIPALMHLNEKQKEVVHKWAEEQQ